MGVSQISSLTFFMSKVAVAVTVTVGDQRFMNLYEYASNSSIDINPQKLQARLGETINLN